MIKAASVEEFASNIGIVTQVSDYRPNDAGRAQQFIDCHVDDVRYVPAFGRWITWEGHYWKLDDDGEIMRFAVRHSQNLIAAFSKISDEQKRAAKVKEALNMGNTSKVKPMLELARCDKRIVVHQSMLDADPFILGVKNAVVELKTGKFRPGRREDLITKRAGCGYIEGAKAERWELFIREILAGDEELMLYVQKLAGYTLTADTSGQCFLFLFGGGNNGKSVFMEVLLALLGEYGQKAPQSLLIANAHGREPTNEIARLQGARMVVGGETEDGTRLAEARVKELTGGDTLTGRFLYEESFDFTPRFKLWMFGNHKPEIRGADNGIWRRVRLIPFTVTIAKEKIDDGLKAHFLTAEMPGILNWAIEGTRRWLAEGLTPPRVVTEASAEYKDEEDSLADFIASEIEYDQEVKTETGDMFIRYQNWCEKNGVKFKLTHRMLNKGLKARGLQFKKSNNKSMWMGVSLS